MGSALIIAKKSRVPNETLNGMATLVNSPGLKIYLVNQWKKSIFSFTNLSLELKGVTLNVWSLEHTAYIL